MTRGRDYLRLWLLQWRLSFYLILRFLFYIVVSDWFGHMPLWFSIGDNAGLQKLLFSCAVPDCFTVICCIRNMTKKYLRLWNIVGELCLYNRSLWLRRSKSQLARLISHSPDISYTSTKVKSIIFKIFVAIKKNLIYCICRLFWFIRNNWARDGEEAWETSVLRGVGYDVVTL